MMLIMRLGIKLPALIGEAETRCLPGAGAVAVAFLCISAALTGCGFQLEGTGSMPATMMRTYVDTETSQSEFVSSLRTALQRRGAEVVSSIQEADSILVVSADDTGQRVLSVSARNIPREYEIYYLVTVALFSGSEQLMEPETIVVTRSYTYDETQVLGKSSEERILREALAADLARQVLRRIESVASQARLPIG